MHGHTERTHGTYEHHPLDAQIQHAGSLSKDLAYGGKEQHSPGGDPSLENDDPVHDLGLPRADDADSIAQQNLAANEAEEDDPLDQLRDA